MKTLKVIAFVLTVIGALNWGLIGVFHFDLVAALFGKMSMLSRLVYILVGFSGVISLMTFYETFSDEV